MRVRHLTLALAVALSGCLTPLDPSSVRIAAVKVTIGDASRTVDTIRVRRATRVQATAFASQGYEIGVTDFAYRSSNVAVATVDQNGVVRGVAPGTAIITATAPQGGSGTVTVVVLTSTVEFTIPIHVVSRDIAFSNDYARAYVTTATDSLVVVDAFGFFKLRTIGLGLPGGHVAATSDVAYVTHPGVDSVSMVSVATNTFVRRIPVAGAPDAVVASTTRAFVAATSANRIVALDNGVVSGTATLAGSPRQLALPRSGNVLFATVSGAAGWSLVAIDASTLAVIRSVALPGEATGLAVNGDGSRVYVLLKAGEVRAFTYSTAGVFASAGTVTVGTNARGIAARTFGSPDVVVSGEPVLILDGPSLAVVDRVAGGGTGAVTIRPDGLFAFVVSADGMTINVIGL